MTCAENNDLCSLADPGKLLIITIVLEKYINFNKGTLVERCFGFKVQDV